MAEHAQAAGSVALNTFVIGLCFAVLAAGCSGAESPKDEPDELVVVSYRVDDGPSHDGSGNDSRGNNDGIAQCGETIELYVTLANEGEVTLTGISAALAVSDRRVRLLYNTSSSYPNLAGGAQGENSEDWDLRIFSATLGGYEFTFTITANEAGPFQHNVTIPIQCDE